VNNIIQGIYYKKISLETLNLLVSNGIIFVLYNLYFISQIDNLGIHVGPLNRNGGTSCSCDASNL
jgi:hypothetical protein